MPGMPSYSKQMRDHQKTSGQWMTTVDLVGPSGARYLFVQKHLSESQARRLSALTMQILRELQAESKEPSYAREAL